jgi:hypothetical protein
MEREYSFNGDCRNIGTDGNGLFATGIRSSDAREIGTEERVENLVNNVLEFDPILYNEAIYYLETAWNRKLTEHERHIAVEIYKWTRTNIEAEEIRILEVVK